MEMSQIGSVADLINLYYEKDENKDARLGPGEVSGVAQNDMDGDNVLAPWEVMEAVNRLKETQVFSSEVIETTKAWNNARFFLPPQNLEEDAVIGGVTCVATDSDVDMDFYPNGQIFWCFLSGGMQLESGTRVEFYSNGRIRAIELPDQIIIISPDGEIAMVVNSRDEIMLMPDGHYERL